MSAMTAWLEEAQPQPPEGESAGAPDAAAGGGAAEGPGGAPGPEDGVKKETLAELQARWEAESRLPPTMMGIDTSKASPGELGFVGNLVAWLFLGVLCVGSVFFTVSREFLPDLVPLDPDDPNLPPSAFSQPAAPAAEPEPEAERVSAAQAPAVEAIGAAEVAEASEAVQVAEAVEAVAEVGAEAAPAAAEAAGLGEPPAEAAVEGAAF